MKLTQVRSIAGLERQPLDQREVDARRREPGARHQEQVRDLAEIVVEPDRGRKGEIGGALLVDAHARACVSECPAT